MVVTIDGVQIINCTPHEIRFQAANGDIVTVEKSGYTLAAKPVEQVVEVRDGTTFVTTVFAGSPQGEQELQAVEAEYPNARIVGSIISAQAYKGRVVSLVPVPGTERSAPQDKRYLPNKFNVFEPESRWGNPPADDTNGPW
jgi:hypothetical protein